MAKDHEGRGTGGTRHGRGWLDDLNKIECGSPICWGALTIIPLIDFRVEGGPVCLPLDLAVARGLGRVEELPGGGRVPRVRVINRGDRPILLIDGEELQGAKQNRVVSLTTLVPPRSTLDVPVACVEEGRWSAVSRGFAVGAALMNPAGRARMMSDVCRSLAEGGVGEADQATVWAGVREVLRDLGVQSPTGALADAQAARRADIERFIQGFEVVRGQVGAVILVGDQVTAVEIVGDTRTWMRLWPRVLGGHALEALDQKGHGARPGGRRRKAGAALRLLREGAWAPRQAVGAGRPLTLEDDRATATAVLLGDSLVHLVAFFDADSTGSIGPRRCEGQLPLGGPSREGRRLSVLVLDDDPSRHADFARQGRGHKIDHVWFVDDAISRLQQRRYDLVCLDNDLETEGFLREGCEVAALIAAMPAERRPRAVLIHSWNRARALEMERILRGSYEAGVSLIRAEFGEFRLIGPGRACVGEADLRRWVERRDPRDKAA